MTRFVFAAVLCFALVSPRFAWGYSFTCAETRAAILNGTDLTAGAAIGHIWGSADVLAGLLCLVNSPKCFCLSNIVDLRNEEFAEESAIELTRCPSGDPTFGAAMRAAQRVCR